MMLYKGSKEGQSQLRPDLIKNKLSVCMNQQTCPQRSLMNEATSN